MRIVAGSLRGRNIAAPEGAGTRPTTDRVREALFSSLYSLLGGFEDAVVLDAFAGSGALGIEALSRGARHAVFCERDPKAASVLKRNVDSCKVASQSRVLTCDFLSAPPKATAGAFNLVFLDPPYSLDSGAVLAAVSDMAKKGVIAAGATVVYEHAIKDAEAVSHAAGDAGFLLVSSKKYGKTGITVLECA